MLMRLVGLCPNLPTVRDGQGNQAELRRLCTRQGNGFGGRITKGFMEKAAGRGFPHTILLCGPSRHCPGP